MVQAKKTEKADVFYRQTPLSTSANIDDLGEGLLSFNLKSTSKCGTSGTIRILEHTIRSHL
jgi:hypothetical protein